MSHLTPFRYAIPVSEALFNHPLYLTHAGWENVPKGTAYHHNDPPYFNFQWDEGRVLGEFCLAMVIEGGGEFESEKNNGVVRPGDAIFYKPGEWHRHRPDFETGWKILWIHFNGNEPLRWMREDLFQLRGNLPIVRHKQLFHDQFECLLEEVYRLFPKNSPNLSRQAIGLLNQFMADDLPDITDRTSTINDLSIQKAVEYIWNFSHGIVDVPSIANHVGLARRTLDRRFRNVTGRSMLEEIQFCRVSRAAKLLEETDLPTKNIVYRAGFRNEEHLRLSFHRAFRQSPQKYRSQFKGLD